MFDENQIALLERAIGLYGTEAQLGMVQEECAELIAAISHYKRRRSSEAEEEVIEETADVLIMVEQARLMLGPQRVDRVIGVKLERLRGRLARRKEEKVKGSFMCPYGQQCKYPWCTDFDARCAKASRER